MTGGWMRATSPNGDAAYEGVVQWTADLGAGLRAAEAGQSGVRDDEATGSKQLRNIFRSTSSRRRAFAVPGPPGQVERAPRKNAQAPAKAEVVIGAAYSIPSVLVFVTSAMLILVGAIGVISVKNPVHAALCLIMTLFGVAVAFVAQSADFLAACRSSSTPAPSSCSSCS